MYKHKKFVPACPMTCRAEVELNIEDFNTISDRVPLLANLKPHGKVRNRLSILVPGPLHFFNLLQCKRKPCNKAGPGDGAETVNHYLIIRLILQYHMADLDVIGGLPVSKLFVVATYPSCYFHSTVQ